MVGILDMGGKGFNKGLKVGVVVSRGMFSRGTIGGDDGVAGVAGLCIVGSSFNDGVRSWGMRSKEMSVLDRPWSGLAAEMRWWRS